MVSSTETPAWSSTLVDRIANKDFVLFIGSGVSANGKNSLGDSPPKWSGLLTVLTREFAAAHRPTYADIVRLIRSRDYLGAAERLAAHCDDRGLLADFREAIVLATDGGDDPVRAFQGSDDTHGLIARLDPVTVVTTNYDRVFERYFPAGYRIKHFRDQDIAEGVRAGKPILLKLHGSADAAGTTILTRSDFTRLRRTGSHALETLSALLLTRTVLFLGYSLDDPDLRLLLENLFGVQGQSGGHVLLGSNKTNATDRKTLKESYGVNLAAYGGDAEGGLKRSLRTLVEQVETQRAAGR